MLNFTALYVRKLESLMSEALSCTFTLLYSYPDESVCFAYITSLWVEGKQTHIPCKADTTNIGTETASYKVLPLGSNVYSLDSMHLIICYPSHPCDSIA